MADFISLNGFIVKDAEARETIEALKYKKRNFILVGDSFADGIINTNERCNGWIENFKTYVGEYAGVYRCTTQMEGVAGFSSSIPFLTILQSMETDITNPLEITDIVVLGGTNDLQYASNVEVAIRNFITYCHTRYPNALVKIGLIGTNIAGLYSNLYTAYSSCVKYGAVFIKDTLCLMCDTSYISDGTHLIEEGYTFYSPYIANAIIGGSCSYHFEFNIPFTSSNYFDENDSLYFIVTENGYTLSYFNNSPNSPSKFKKIGIISGSSSEFEIDLGVLNIPKLYCYYTRLLSGICFKTIEISSGQYVTAISRDYSCYITPDGHLMMTLGIPNFYDINESLTVSFGVNSMSTIL